jgi:hypothetical protein
MAVPRIALGVAVNCCPGVDSSRKPSLVKRFLGKVRAGLQSRAGVPKARCPRTRIAARPVAWLYSSSQSTQPAVGALRDSGGRLRSGRWRRGREHLTAFAAGILGGPTAVAVKMRDIAKDLGVSVITVSKVLRNHPDVGRDTRAR